MSNTEYLRSLYAALDVPRAIRDALNEPPFGHHIKGRPAEGEGYCTCGYGTEDDHFDSIEEHIAKVVAARLSQSAMEQDR